ncbi:hypothetical protein NQ318_012627 [Aromia moschata]|uniref:Uncharacterized protein n=1 Tax=Aromia moschata TaxID=1265417 RepID=A0AAV8XJL1_9CUCU|nr:hypothetical protein NQ318_012627 [Aromia moschata]
MQRSLGQGMAIKFCVKLKKSAAETIPMLKKAFGVDCLSDRQIFRQRPSQTALDGHQPPVPTTMITACKILCPVSSRSLFDGEFHKLQSYQRRTRGLLVMNRASTPKQSSNHALEEPELAKAKNSQDEQIQI